MAQLLNVMTRVVWLEKMPTNSVQILINSKFFLWPNERIFLKTFFGNIVLNYGLVAEIWTKNCIFRGFLAFPGNPWKKPEIFMAYVHPRNLLNIIAFGTSHRYCFFEEEIRLKAADTHPSIHPSIHSYIPRKDELINAILQNGNCAKNLDYENSKNDYKM